MKAELALGAVVDFASPAEVDSSNDRLFDRLTGNRKRGLYRTIPGTFQLPAATYSNGVEGVINFGSPADAKFWFVRGVTWVAVDNSTTPPGWGEGEVSVNFMIGHAPKQITAAGGVSRVEPRPSVLDLVVFNVGTGDTFNQTYPVSRDQDAYLYLVAVGSTVITNTLTYFGALHVYEVDATDVLVGGV